MTYSKSNPFYNILKLNASVHKVYEDDFCLAFLDIAPQGPGHTLVIPKTVYAVNVFDIDEETYGALALRVHKVARLITRALQAPSIEIQQLNGVSAGQTVGHIHFHLIPRFKGVPILSHTAAKQVDDWILKSVAEKIQGKK